MPKLLLSDSSPSKPNLHFSWLFFAFAFALRSQRALPGETRRHAHTLRRVRLFALDPSVARWVLFSILPDLKRRGTTKDQERFFSPGSRSFGSCFYLYMFIKIYSSSGSLDSGMWSPDTSSDGEFCLSSVVIIGQRPPFWPLRGKDCVCSSHTSPSTYTSVLHGWKTSDHSSRCGAQRTHLNDLPRACTC